MDAHIQVTGGSEIDELASLWQWLRDADELRGYVSPVERPIGETELGGVADLLTVVVGSSSTAVALSRVLVAWLQTRRSDVKVRVSVGARTVELEATDVDAVGSLVQQVLGAAEEPAEGP